MEIKIIDNSVSVDTTETIVETVEVVGVGPQGPSGEISQAQLQAYAQPLNSNLTSISALATTTIGRALLLESVSPVGSGALARVTSPTFVTPNIGAASGTSLQTSGSIISNTKINVPYTSGSERYLISGVANFGREFGLYIQADGNEGGFKADSAFNLKASSSITLNFTSTVTTSSFVPTSTSSVRWNNINNTGIDLSGSNSTGLVSLVTNTGGLYASLAAKDITASGTATVTGNASVSGVLLVNNYIRSFQAVDTAAVKRGVWIESTYGVGSTIPSISFYGTALGDIAQIYPLRTAGSFATDLNFDVISAGGTLQNILKLSSGQVATFAGNITVNSTINAPSATNLNLIAGSSGAQINLGQSISGDINFRPGAGGGGKITCDMNAGPATITMSGTAGNGRSFIYQSSNVTRWNLNTNGTAESGSNAGSDFQITRYSDAGAQLGHALVITRSTGNTTLSGGIIIGQGVATNTKQVLVGSNFSTGFGGLYIIGSATLTTDYSELQSLNEGTGYNPLVFQRRGGPVLIGTGTVDGSSAILQVAGTSTLTGAIGIGTTSGNNSLINIGGTFAGGNNAFGVYTGGLTLQPTNTFSAFFQYAGGGTVSAGSNTIANAYGLFIAPYSKTGAGTITTAYGIKIGTPTVGATNYSLWTDGVTAFGNGSDYTLITRASGSTGRLAISRPNSSTDSVSFGGGNAEIYIRGGLGTLTHSGVDFSIQAATSNLNLGASGTILIAGASSIVIQAGTTAAVTGTSFTFPFQTLSADPTTSDIATGNVRVVKNTTSGAIKLWVNDGGVMKSVALT